MGYKLKGKTRQIWCTKKISFQDDLKSLKSGKVFVSYHKLIRLEHKIPENFFEQFLNRIFAVDNQPMSLTRKGDEQNDLDHTIFHSVGNRKELPQQFYGRT